MGQIKDRLAARMAKLQLQCCILRQHVDLDGMEAAQLPAAGGEQNPAWQGTRHQVGADRAVEIGRVGQVVQDQQGIRVIAQVTSSRADLLIRRQVGCGRMQFSA